LKEPEAERRPAEPKAETADPSDAGMIDAFEHLELALRGAR
jgi:hypothetical protein